MKYSAWFLLISLYAISDVLSKDVRIEIAESRWTNAPSSLVGHSHREDSAADRLVTEEAGRSAEQRTFQTLRQNSTEKLFHDHHAYRLGTAKAMCRVQVGCAQQSSLSSHDHSFSLA